MHTSIPKPIIFPSTTLSSHLFKRATKPENKIITSEKEIQTKVKECNYSLLTSNVRSLTRNFSEFENIVNNMKPNFICISETWNIHKGFVNLNNYHEIITRVRKNKRGGGVGIYVNKQYKFKTNDQINNLELDKLEIIAVDIYIENKTLLLISIYKSPEVDIKTAINDLEKILSMTRNKRTIISGDMNIDIANKTNRTLHRQTTRTQHDTNSFSIHKTYIHFQHTY